MSKSVFIAEKPSVAREFAKALHSDFKSADGYMESDKYIVTWCVGHLVTMSYPEAYDPVLKKWSLSTLPFSPKDFKYELIPATKKQFFVVKKILNRKDVDKIYVCTDSGREGELIYRLVKQEAKVTDKDERRVWIDSQTEEEIKRGITEAKPLSEYDNLSSAAYLRQIEDYLMGINFSRLLTLTYGNDVARKISMDRCVIAIGRVMTCVLGMIVNREREIRNFVTTPYYKVISKSDSFSAEWKVTDTSRYLDSSLIYKDNGFYDKEEACSFAEDLYKKQDLEIKEGDIKFILKNNKINADANDLDDADSDGILENGTDSPETENNAQTEEKRLTAVISSLSKKKEKVSAPLLYNLAELQNECSKFFKISPDETLKIVQELYEKKLTTYPRTDARVLSTAIAKVVNKNIAGLGNIPAFAPAVKFILDNNLYAGIAKTKYVDDKKITDHYAIIPTGQGFGALSSLSATAKKVYEIICRRFLSIFYPPAVYEKIALEIELPVNGRTKTHDAVKTDTAESGESRSDAVTPEESKSDVNHVENSLAHKEYKENFNASFKALREKGYLEIAKPSFSKDKSSESEISPEVLKLKKGDKIFINCLEVKESETVPPKRYNSGSIILAMENAGKLIENEDLRAQIKNSGIGTSSTRAEILKKLNTNKYISTNKKTQVLTPTLMGEVIYDATSISIPQLLNPAFTASWEKGLNFVSNGVITSEEYMQKLSGFIDIRTRAVIQCNNKSVLMNKINELKKYYKNIR